MLEIDALMQGPLTVRWASSDAVHVIKDDATIAQVPVRGASIAKIAKPQGNRKTENVCGIIDSIHLGCLRRATGLPQCDLPCYQTEGLSAGCFANAGEYPAKSNHRDKDFDVCHNGLLNDLLAVRLPLTGDASLRRYRDGGITEPLVWRVDAESSDGAMSISLGILQMWAETNPQMRFRRECGLSGRSRQGRAPVRGAQYPTQERHIAVTR